ncbi:unnamed protein product [Chrysodeixis includens]|uniref:Uncharacterized protein n=1 Tax=Chrysodeixis includens TaxID=689277 RepID=A0A9N8KTS0_CHRIL|nr:unnamed protein product [Chrysodeixis includens]
MYVEENCIAWLPEVFSKGWRKRKRQVVLNIVCGDGRAPSGKAPARCGGETKLARVHNERVNKNDAAQMEYAGDAIVDTQKKGNHST